MSEDIQHMLTPIISDAKIDHWWEVLEHYSILRNPRTEFSVDWPADGFSVPKAEPPLKKLGPNSLMFDFPVIL